MYNVMKRFKFKINAVLLKKVFRKKSFYSLKNPHGLQKINTFLKKQHNCFQHC